MAFAKCLSTGSPWGQGTCSGRVACAGWPLAMRDGVGSGLSCWVPPPPPPCPIRTCLCSWGHGRRWRLSRDNWRPPHGDWRALRRGLRIAGMLARREVAWTVSASSLGSRQPEHSGQAAPAPARGCASGCLCASPAPLTWFVSSGQCWRSASGMLAQVRATSLQTVLWRTVTRLVCSAPSVRHHTQGFVVGLNSGPCARLSRLLSPQSTASHFPCQGSDASRGDRAVHSHAGQSARWTGGGGVVAQRAGPQHSLQGAASAVVPPQLQCWGAARAWHAQDGCHVPELCCREG